jgi:uncharacterized protein YacL
MDNNKVKYLEMIENIITRMADNSFKIKGWTITLVSALLALGSLKYISYFIIIAIIPVICFALLDAYYLSIERKFRSLYDQVRSLKSEIDFNIDIEQLKDTKKNSWPNCLKSKSVWIFYLSILASLIALLGIVNLGLL